MQYASWKPVLGLALASLLMVGTPLFVAGNGRAPRWHRFLTAGLARRHIQALHEVMENETDPGRSYAGYLIHAHFRGAGRVPWLERAMVSGRTAPTVGYLMRPGVLDRPRSGRIDLAALRSGLPGLERAFFERIERLMRELGGAQPDLRLVTQLLGSAAGLPLTPPFPHTTAVVSDCARVLVDLGVPPEPARRIAARSAGGLHRSFLGALASGVERLAVRAALAGDVSLAVGLLRQLCRFLGRLQELELMSGERDYLAAAEANALEELAGLLDRTSPNEAHRARVQALARRPAPPSRFIDLAVTEPGSSWILYDAAGLALAGVVFLGALQVIVCAAMGLTRLRMGFITYTALRFYWPTFLVTLLFYVQFLAAGALFLFVEPYLQESPERRIFRVALVLLCGFSTTLLGFHVFVAARWRRSGRLESPVSLKNFWSLWSAGFLCLALVFFLADNMSLRASQPFVVESRSYERTLWLSSPLLRAIIEADWTSDDYGGNLVARALVSTALPVFLFGFGILLLCSLLRWLYLVARPTRWATLPGIYHYLKVLGFGFLLLMVPLAAAATALFLRAEALLRGWLEGP